MLWEGNKFVRGSMAIFLMVYLSLAIYGTSPHAILVNMLLNQILLRSVGATGTVAKWNEDHTICTLVFIGEWQKLFTLYMFGTISTPSV